MGKQYLVAKGISYKKTKRAEPGDVVNDLPSHDIKGLLAQGAIKEIPEDEGGEKE